ncbi:deoxynucleoside kinase [Enterococcus cecorum]|uniref:deoxynucleoside kinase n=1 Tax=Enterococcus cecorum TaxID=44008 RepID=UPI001FAD8169|nr:deoxynucleoside kinase [Enterococcus cecorum]MCJ0552589.1 deoxynucleoside kinase [Enterococcus cecorum]MCJ0557653.1 deoxynucleoside kinase [Enterococcus cecorum]MCJ0563148.1 deoxynucleoside kinase [Enterococcus cecorum]MDZ5584846.1 deoxynucleoside kinase [Enterococcus cecorum]
MIIVSRVYSSGKTTLAKNLAKYFHSKAHIVESRQTDNPLYDKAKGTISCSYDEDFLMERMKQIGEAMTEPYTVFDRSVYEDVLRMKISADLGFLDQEEAEDYFAWINKLLSKIPLDRSNEASQILLFLDLPFHDMIDRIYQVPKVKEYIMTHSFLYEYYQESHLRYREWFENYHYSEKLRINALDYDFNNMDDVAKVAKQIEEIYQNPKFEITYDAIVDNMRQSLVNNNSI